MTCIRRYWKHVLFGLAVGSASFELWQYTLRSRVPQWLLCAIAVAFVLVMESAAAGVRGWRARRALPRRRAHARHPGPRQGRVRDLQTPTSTPSEGEA